MPGRFSNRSSRSLEEVYSSVETKRSGKSWKSVFAFLGPAYLVSVGYMDPGNWATDLEGGSRYGYSLIWVLVLSNLMALVLQNLCARLGIVYKKDLAQVNRETYPPLVNFCLYLLAEAAIAACDLAEIIGMAIGMKLLFGLPMLWGISLTILDTLLLLYLQKLGMRKMEAFIIGLIAIILLSFGIELFFVKPAGTEIIQGLRPVLQDDYALYIAIGIIGATVMPHNLYLHSALVQTRVIGEEEASKKRALKWNFIDSLVALNLALLVNAAILILAAAVFFKHGLVTVSGIEDAHQLLAPLVGNRLAPVLFAVALIAAGQSSTITGTLAGQIVMEGYLHLRINPWMRRLLTRLLAIIPAFVTIWLAGENQMTSLLILSQVVLSVQLSFAVIPLIYSVSNKHMMKQFVIKPWLLILSITVAAVILYLNIKMVWNRSMAYLESHPPVWISVLLIGGLIAFTVILLATIVIPLIRRNEKDVLTDIHSETADWSISRIPDYKRIALALDFSLMDERILSYAVKQSNPDTEWLLIHVVESAAARMHGAMVADRETETDLERLQAYQEKLQGMGHKTIICLGYRHRVHEIARICETEQAELLILGAHGHSGLFDFIYGQTIESVRHRLKIPVLIVNR